MYVHMEIFIVIRKKIQNIHIHNKMMMYEILFEESALNLLY